MLAFAVLFGMTASFAQTTAKREVKLPAAMAKELPVNSEKHQRPDLQRQNALLTPHSRQLLGGQRTDRLQMPWQKSTARKALSDEPIYQPEGTYQLYSFNGDGYASSWFGILADHFVGKVAEVVVGSSNDIYVKNLMTEYTYGTWSKGVISGSKVNFDFPHQIELEGSIYYLWLMRYDAEQGTYAAEDGLNTLTLDYDPQTGSMTTPAGSDFATGDVVIGLGDETGAWYGYADYNLSLAPVTDEPVEAPEGLQTEQYSVVADGFDGTIAQVGFVGDEVYVQGLYGGMPEAWIKGVKDGDRVTFKSGQYLGADLSAGFHQYFVSATYDYENDENYGPSYTYYLNNDDVVFTYDAADKSLRTSQTFLVNSGTEQVNYAAVYRGALLRPFTEVAATPAAPEWIEIYNGGWNYYKSGWGWGYVHFNVPCADVDGNYILPDKLSYIIYIRVNGEEKPLELNWYDYRNLTEATMSEMPYAFSDGWDIYANGIEREIYFYVVGPEAFGLQTVYRGAGEERRSDIVWQEFDGVASAVQPDAATPDYPEVAAGNVGESIGYSPYTGNESRATFGDWKPQTYDVAVHLDDATLVGTHIDQITFPVRKLEGTTGYKVWLTSQLRVENGVNVPDLLSIDVEPTATGDCTVTLERPYTIPEGGVYVGYSVTVDEEDAEAEGGPVQTVDEVKTTGFYLHTSRGFLKWVNVADDLSASAVVSVTVSGSTIKKNAVAPLAGDMQYVKAGEAISVPVTFSNHGSEGITSLNVEYTLDGNSMVKSYNLKKAVAGQFGLTYDATIAMPAIDKAGTYDLEVKVVSVNGVDNEDVAPVAVTKVAVLNWVPKHRTLLEEYTGTWCGWCPRGFVALELLKEQYPDEFVTVSYHNADVMEILSADQFPSPVSGFPDAWMDRGMEVDPYYGTDETYSKDFNVVSDLQWRNAQFANASVDAEAVLSEDESTVDVSASVTFPYSTDEADFALEYILVEDGLTGEGAGWDQSNYFSGSEGYGEQMSDFVNGESTVSGLVFNDVAVAVSEIGGISESIPAQVVAEEPVTHTYEFYPDNVYNTSWEPLVQDKSKLSVVVLLIDRKNGYVANAVKVPVRSWQSVGISDASVSGGATAGRSAYDLQGRRLERMPQHKGVYVVAGRKVVVK